MTSLGYLQYSDINESPPINSGIGDKNKGKHNMTIRKRPTNIDGMQSGGMQSGGMQSGGMQSGGENVKNMLKLINNSNGYENENENENDEGGLADFNPPPRAQLAKNKMSNVSSEIPAPSLAAVEVDFEIPTQNLAQTQQQQQPSPRQYQLPLDYSNGMEGFNTKQYLPYLNQMDQPSGGNKDQLLEKLNYMIHLLEEQKDEKTGHVMEEVILYSFLGVFIIFIVDSFARAGKYTR